MMKARVLVLYATAIAGCHGDSSQAPPVNPAPQGHAAPAAGARKPMPKDSTAGMVEAAVQGKSQAPVALKFDLLQRPAVGQPFEIAVALLPQVDASSATIDVSGSVGLQLAAGDEKVEFPSLGAGQVYRRSIVLTPAADGLLFVTLSVRLKHDEMTEMKVFAVPVIVGVAATPDEGAVAKPKK
jgi:hypothetical protein